MQEGAESGLPPLLLCLGGCVSSMGLTHRARPSWGSNSFGMVLVAVGLVPGQPWPWASFCKPVWTQGSLPNFGEFSISSLPSSVQPIPCIQFPLWKDLEQFLPHPPTDTEKHQELTKGVIQVFL